MLSFFKNGARQAEAVLDALSKSQAVIEFDLDGTILTANQNFLTLMGYRLEEVRGQKHALFVEPSYRDSAEYRDFWDKLRRGQFQQAQFKRIAKGGKEVWIEGSYNPILGSDGRPVKVVKYATDITASKMENADLQGKINAILRAQAVIEFKLDGTVITANQNFLNVLGYRLDEIQGKNHSMFVEDAYRSSADYKKFWDDLRRGEFRQAQFKRIGKGGKVVWIEASYNPIFDPDGKPYKVVKFATDISEQIARLSDLKKLIDVNFSEIDQAMRQTHEQSGAAQSAVEETSANVQTVASSAEELASSIHEISESMSKSQIATEGAFNQVVAAGEATQRLSDAAIAMGGIVGMIQNIAGQINLLALNATIESARAGEAGKGFAVVANEVKNLANQAARATEQITQEIEGVQSISTEVVSALEGIRGSIDSVREYVAATASAVEEQSAVTRDMSSNMQSTAVAVESIAGSIQTISSAVVQVDSTISKTKDAVVVLAR